MQQMAHHSGREDAGRLSLKVAQEVASTQGGSCLSSKYVNNRKHLKWRCREGHEWNASLSSVKDEGTWCPACAHASRRLSLRVAHDVAVLRHGLCLSNKYVNNRGHLRWRCQEGHEWNASLSNIKDRGRWCPHCAIEARRLSLTVAQGAAEAKGGICLSIEYQSNMKHLRWRCRNGHEWKASLARVKDGGTWCPHCAKESRRLSLRVAQDVAVAKGGVCLSTNYVYSHRRLTWRCREGHEWNASLNSIKDGGTWCPHCAIKNRCLSLRDAQDVAETRGGLCLSTTYRKSRLHLRWRCHEGHEWKASLSSVKHRGSWCPHCATAARRLSLKVAQDVAAGRGGACLSTIYHNSLFPLQWRCKRGHKWSACLASVKAAGTWCPYCARISQRLTLKVACDIALAKGGICLSTTYVNSRQHLTWRCRQGHEWKASLTSVKNAGSWCPHCVVASRRLTLKCAQNVAKVNGGRCLSTRYVNNKLNLRWRCAESHEWHASLRSVKNGGTWCPLCAAGRSEREVRNILEAVIFPGHSFPKCRPWFLRSSEHGRCLELDGYCEELGIAFEYQGEQHYNSRIFFHRGKEGAFEKLQLRDKLKARLCYEAGVRLLVVPFFEKVSVALLQRLLGRMDDAQAVQQEMPVHLEKRLQVGSFMNSPPRHLSLCGAWVSSGREMVSVWTLLSSMPTCSFIILLREHVI